LCLFASCLATSPARSQTLAGSITYAPQSVFRIPFVTDAGERQLQEVRLWVSEDQGQSWRKYGNGVAPEQRGFTFRAEHDGHYWFTVQTVDFAGRLNPPTVQGPQPQPGALPLKVCVDTRRPDITLRSRPAREGMVAVEWDIREENLDPSSFTLEYRLPGSVEWIPLVAEPSLLGERAWTPGTTGAVAVRLRVRDLAKNEAEASLIVTPGGQEFRSASSGGDAQAGRSPGVAVPAKRWVNSKHITLNYEIQEKGPSGVSAVELWFTRDGQKWEKYPKEQTTPPAPFTFEVYEEGVYGFTLVIRNGVGLGEAPPHVGDPPQIWVEVDLTKPIVHFVKTEVGMGSDTGNLTITWAASDKNLSREPISLFFAEDAKGPWTPIEKNLENTGRYVWRKGPGAPHRFLVKVEAADRAGNVGEAVTLKPVLFDLTQPKGRILGVEPAAGKVEVGTGSE
jgi:hypothetical protein